MRPRSLLFSFVLLLTVGGLIPVLADSLYVEVRNSSGFAGPPGLTPKEPYVPNCAQIGTSSASCSTVTSNTGFRDYGDSGTASASAAFGNVHTGFAEGPASGGTAVALSGDKVVVAGGSGSGTLVSHYYLISEGEAQFAGAAKFSFVQDSTRTDVSAKYQYFGSTPIPQSSVPSGCESVGFCFSEAFDVTSPVQFGTAILLGARLDAGSSGGTLIPPYGGTTAYASIMLNGYTVLDASGNVIADASVTQQHVAGLDLFPAPEPGTWGLMVMGLAGLAVWRGRRRKSERR